MQDPSSSMTPPVPAPLPEGRPRAVTVVAWLFIATGVVGLVYYATAFDAQRPYGEAWVLVLRALALVVGVYLLRGANWARWLALAWLAYHVALSVLHSVHEAVVHGLLLAGVAYVLLRPDASAYFRIGKRPPRATSGT